MEGLSEGAEEGGDVENEAGLDGNSAGGLSRNGTPAGNLPGRIADRSQDEGHDVEDHTQLYAVSGGADESNAGETQPFRGTGPPIMATVSIDDFVRAVVSEINVFRENPQEYAQELSALRNCYRGSFLTYPDGGAEVETIEGVEALEECLQDLESLSALPAVTVSRALCGACQQHLADFQANDFCSHIGTDGSTPEERLARFGEHREQCGENIVFGMLSAKDVVYHMLIDDGSPDRGHRANLLNMDFHFIGLAHGDHPSAETATVVLLVDRFRAKQISMAEQKRNIIEASIGQAIPDQANVRRDVTTHRVWDRLMQDVKPDHLAVPGRLLDHVHRNHRPKLYREKVLPVAKYPLGELAPAPGIDPTIVRAFVHRIDRNHDDCIVEPELEDISYQHKLDITQKDIAALIDEILQRRPWHDRNRRAVDWLEILAAMKAHKEWVPAVDVHVERDGERYQLTAQVEELEKWCSDVFQELSSKTDDLVQPTLPSCTTRSLPRRSGGAERIRALNNFLASLLTATDSQTGEPLQSSMSVQRLLGRPQQARRSGTKPPEISKAVCLGLRRLWAHKLRPHRATWLVLHRAVGLHPLVAPPVHKPPAAFKEEPIETHVNKAFEEQQRRNVARPDAKYIGMSAAAAKMRTSEKPERVRARTQAFGGSTDQPTMVDTTGPSMASRPLVRDDYPVPALGQTQGAATKVWDEHRQQTETLVNRSLGNAARREQSNAGLGSGAGMVYSFEVQRRFNQVAAKQQRASEEQRYLGTERRAAKSMAGTLGATATGRSISTPVAGSTYTASGLGLPNHGARSRGAGAFSVAAPAGVRGHFHNTLAVHAKDSSHGWPQSLSTSLDGAHIDHTRDAPQKGVDNFGQPVGYSKMSKEERSQQFTTYLKHPALGSSAQGVHDNLAAKCKAATRSAAERETYSGWKPHDFREDIPTRLGKFGRRDFDPQVREKPVQNPNNVSQIEDKPMEFFVRQQERVDDFLGRTMPPGKGADFKTYMPTAAKPKRHEEMASRAPMHSILDGSQKLVSRGFGQNRHSDCNDYKVHTRPLGIGHMDKLLPIA